NVDVTVGALVSAGIEDVFVTYTSTPSSAGAGLQPLTVNTLYGHWSSLQLTQTSNVSNAVGLIRHYTGSIDTTGTGAAITSLQLFPQPDSGTGLVSGSPNNGQYFSFVPSTASLGSPKVATTLAFDPSNVYTPTYRAKLTVSATLTNSATGAAIAGKIVSFTF